MFNPTPEQEAILQAASNTKTSIMVNAMAGCAKTTTLILLAKTLPVAPSLALAFNVKIKKELESRFPPHFKVSTLNGLGHNAFGKAIGKRCAVEPDKTYKLVKAYLKAQGLGATGDEFSTALALLRRAKAYGLVPASFKKDGLIPDTEEGWQELADSLYLDLPPDMIPHLRAMLIESVKQAFAGVIDYDDQIYMSALFAGIFPRFPLVMVDEAQDLSPLNHIMVARTAADRLIVVGDPRQAIYAFRGADSASMDKLQALRKDWTHLPLSTTFRCPKLVVARQQKHAAGFSAAPSAPDGQVLDWRDKETWALPEGEVAILCRNNAPLFKMGLKLIAQGIGFSMLGGDLGKALIAFSKKLFPDPDSSQEDALVILKDWQETEISKAVANDKQDRVAVITDKAECLRAVIESEYVKKAGDVTRVLTLLFNSESLRVTLATGHKSKGLEWQTVIHLDPWRVPSKYAKEALAMGNPVPMEQDLNLRYVIETRTKNTLILANLEHFESGNA